MLETKNVLDTVRGYLASDSMKLPVYSAVAAKVQTIAANPDSSADDVERVLMRDMSLASLLLRMANSAFYGGMSRVTTIKAAIMRMGMSQVVTLAVVCAQREQFRANDPLVSALATRLWQHAIGSAFGAKWIAEASGRRALADEVFLAGLFHDIGELLVLKAIEEVRRARPREAMPGPEIVEALDALHCEQGARLIAAWNLPSSYAQVARMHHAGAAEQSDLCLMVRVADRMCEHLGYDVRGTESAAAGAPHDPVNWPEAQRLGLDDELLQDLKTTLRDNISALCAA